MQKNKNLKINDLVGEESLEIMAQAQWYNKYLYDLMKDYLGNICLEVGSGIGNFTDMLAENGRKVYATDINTYYTKHLKSQKIGKNVVVMKGNIESNEFEKRIEKVDSVVCLNVLEHIKNHQKAFRNMKSKLKKGGNLILLVPAHKFLFGALDVHLGHYRRYNIPEVEALSKKENMVIKKLHYLNSISISGWFIVGKILKRKVISSSQIGMFNKVAKPFLLLEKYIKPPIGLSVFLVAANN